MYTIYFITLKKTIFRSIILFKVNTLALTKPDKAQMVENHLVQMARSGQLMNKV